MSGSEVAESTSCMYAALSAIHQRNRQHITYEEEGEVEVGERRPSEEELDRIVDELELEEKFPEEALS